MIDFVTQHFYSALSSLLGKRSLEEEVRYSVKKYYNTYKKLEEYDKSSKKDSEVLVDPEGLRDYFQPLY